MNTLHLKYAVEIEKTGSITKAAENLFMGQPTLSKTIKELESNLGITIFKRTSKGVLPTKKGTEFLNYARNILSQIDEMESLYKSDKKQSFSIAVPRASYISKALTGFIKELDQINSININYKETNAIRAINKVSVGEYRFGIIRYQSIYENYFTSFLTDKNFSIKPLWEFECLAIMNENHPLASNESISYDDLIKFIEVVHGDNVVPYLSVDNKNNVKNPSKKIYIYERGSQFDLLSDIYGSYMLTSPIPLGILHRNSLIQRKCNYVDGKYKDVIIYPDNYQFTELDKSFFDKLQKTIKEVSEIDYH